MATRPQNTTPAVPPTIPGVDVSSFQGPPGAWRAEASKVKWVAVKLTELQPKNVHYVNPDAAEDWAFVGRQKMGRIGYLFGHPSVSAADSVAFFASEIRSLGLKDTDGIMLDLETTDGLAPRQVSAWAVAVMANLRKAFRRMPILYTFISFATEGNTAGLGKYPLWISDPSSPVGRPVVPPPWKNWTIHQYSIGGAIDRDVAKFATVAAMEQAFGAAVSPPPRPVEGDLGGAISSGVTVARWGNGDMVIAGIDGLGHIAIRRFDASTGKWGVWWNPAGTTKVAGPPALVAWDNGLGQMFYAGENGHVIALATKDAGGSWQ